MVLRSLFSALCKMTLYNLLVGILVAIFLGSAVYRENSWSRSNFKLRNQIIGYEKDIESLKLQLLIDELVDYKPDASLTGSNYCILNSETGENIPERQLIDKIDEFSLSAFQEKLLKIVESTSDAVNIKKIDLRVIMKPYILNWSGLLTVLLCVLVMLLEIFRGHSSTVFSTTSPMTEDEKEEEKKGNPNPRKWSLSNKYFETYIAKKKILSNFFMYPVLFLSALFSWSFSQSRGAINSFLFKFLIQWMIAGYLAYFVFNFTRLMKYFPKDREETWKCLFKLSWWQWMLPRVFTSEGFIFANFQTGDNGIIPAVFSLAGCIGADLVCFYPYYYFYYYLSSLHFSYSSLLLIFSSLHLLFIVSISTRGNCGEYDRGGGSGPLLCFDCFSSSSLATAERAPPLTWYPALVNASRTASRVWLLPAPAMPCRTRMDSLELVSSRTASIWSKLRPLRSRSTFCSF